MTLGIIELPIGLMLSVVGLIFPIAILVLLYLTYAAVKRIERKLGDGD